jgi:large repetitive protein
MICEKEFTLAVSACFTNPTSLPTAYFNAVYSTTLAPLVAVPGTFSISGSLPSGLSLNPVTGTIAGMPNNAGQLGTFNFTATFTPTDTGITPCSQDFSMALEIYCVAIEDLTWTISNPSGSAYTMAGGDGTFAIHRAAQGDKFDQMTSSTLRCLPAVFSQYPATLEIDYNYTLHLSGFEITVGKNGPLIPSLADDDTGPPDESASGTFTISLGMLAAGQSYVFTILFATGIPTGAGTLDLTGAIRIRPLTPP